MRYASSRSASSGGAIAAAFAKAGTPRSMPAPARVVALDTARPTQHDGKETKHMTGLIAPQTASIPAGSEGTAQQDHFDPLGVPRGRRTSKSGTTSAPIGPQHPVDHIGGSACVIHSLCCPVGGRPASPRKSHSKSQRGQPSGDSQLRQATVEAGQVPSEPHRATPSDTREVTGGQGVAGSNPAVSTGSQVFSNIFTPHQSQQKSQSPSKRPSQRRTPTMRPGGLPGRLPHRQRQRSRRSRGQRSASLREHRGPPGSSSSHARLLPFRRTDFGSRSTHCGPGRAGLG
jgi:hypothetical protein